MGFCGIVMLLPFLRVVLVSGKVNRLFTSLEDGPQRAFPEDSLRNDSKRHSSSGDDGDGAN